MHQPAAITPAELEAAIKGRVDGLHGRMVALLVLKGTVRPQAAITKFEITRAALYRATIAVEEALSEQVKTARLANEFRAPMTPSKDYPSKSMTNPPAPRIVDPS